MTMWLPSRKMFIQGKGLVMEAIFWEVTTFLLFCFCFVFFCRVEAGSPTCLLLLEQYDLLSPPHSRVSLFLPIFAFCTCWWCYLSTLTELYQYFCAYFLFWEIFVDRKNWVSFPFGLCFNFHHFFFHYFPFVHFFPPREMQTLLAKYSKNWFIRFKLSLIQDQLIEGWICFQEHAFIPWLFILKITNIM